MAEFLAAIKKALLHEGGFVNDPDDSGGMTYCGISRKNWPKWAGWAIIDKLLPLKKGEIINDSELLGLVNLFYKQNFWDKIQGDYITFQERAEQLFDQTLPFGVMAAIKDEQKALNIPVTGRMDAITLAAINSSIKDII